LTKIPTTKIVICDGTGFDWSLYFPLNSNFETIHFNNSQDKVNEYGKGYGEVEIINYAIVNSETLKLHNCFYKLTAKYSLKNIEKYIFNKPKSSFKCYGGFNLKRMSLDYVQTIFWYSTVDFYIKNFSNLYQYINDHAGHDMEVAMASIIKKNNIKNYQMSIIPMIMGWSGTSNRYIDAAQYVKFHRVVKNYLLSYIL
jgi:hypothetical protein